MSVFKKKNDDDVPDVSLEDLDDLLSALTADELEELNGTFDPDNSLLPPSQRSKDQTSKPETGPFNRQRLIQFIEDKAKHEKDWENVVPYTEEKKGKMFIPKEAEKVQILGDEDAALETEWDEILAQATEDELVDLAAVLGFHSMLTQTQYHSAFVDGGASKQDGGFKGLAQAQKLRLLPDELPNQTDVEESIKKLKANDKELKGLNINNIKNVPIDRLVGLCDALKTNTVCVKLEMASVAANDAVANALASALSENTTLRSLNVESNFISPEAIVKLLKAINEKQILLELRVANQKPEVLGNRAEMEIAKLVRENNTMLRFGIVFEFPDARFKVTEKLKSNFDTLRQKRVETA